jgi:hypothetical protein
MCLSITSEGSFTPSGRMGCVAVFLRGGSGVTWYWMGQCPVMSWPANLAF